MKSILFSFLGLCLLVLLSVPISYFIISCSASNRTYDNTAKIPYNEVAIVLGTPVTMPDGSANICFQKRVEAAYELYTAKKVDMFIASGAKDEPTAIKKYLLSHGVPENKILLDYSGFRTLNSIVNIKKVCNVKSITIVSQKFHNERAICIAENLNISAVGYNAEMNLNPNDKNKVPIREYFARVKFLIDRILVVD